MRYIFIDEAGTAANEPVTAVVAVIVDADKKLSSAEKLVEEILRGVPGNHKQKFVFHATEIFNSRKYQDEWSMTDRLNLLYSMMSVPRKIRLPITLSLVWRSAEDFEKIEATLNEINKAQFQHIMAFSNCVAVTDRNIRKHGRPEEVATIICEDIPELRRFLKAVPVSLKCSPEYIPPKMLRKTQSDNEAGFIRQSGDMRVERIRNTVYFAEKAEDPLVQVADAIAFGFRRYFANQSFGEEFVQHILGENAERILRDFAPPSGTVCWWPRESVNYAT